MRIGNLSVPTGWSCSTVGESCRICDNLRKPISLEVRRTMQGEYPYYGPTGILDYIDHYRFNGEYVLIGEDGDHFLKYRDRDMTLLVEGKFNVNNHAHVLHGKGNCTTAWIYRFFQRRELMPFLTRQGAGRYKLNRDALGRLPILIPPVEEQNKIHRILSKWDEAIALTERRIEAAQQHKRGLMQRLVTGRVRFPKFVQSSERFNTKFGKLPVDWEVMPLQKLVKPISRLETIQSDREYRLIGVKWYTAGAHVHSILPGKDIKTASLSRIEENDIIYNKMWTTKGAFAVAKPEHNGTYGTTEYPQFRARENLLWIDFLKYVFQLPRFQYDATTLCRGTTGRARLNPRDFLKLEIPLPSVKEQRRIAAVLQSCDHQIELLTQKRDALERQKKGLMQRLLTGRVRVKV